MKHNTICFALAAALLLSIGVHHAEAQSQSPLIPTGELSAFPTFVQTGTHPTLTWSVTLPQAVTDVVTITPPGELTPKQSMTMKVRVLGASVKRVWLNSRGQITSWEWVPTEALLKYNSGSYTRIFYNTQDKVNPNTVVKTMTVAKNSSINFAGRYYVDGTWSTMYNSASGQQVYALKDGDTPPTTTPLYQQPTIESFLLPYLDDQGKIDLGPRDVIYLMELTHTNRNDDGYDLQDLALLVTFSE
ncbi:MAG TPA: hypothetical protein PLA50_00240 [Bacteroidia bacterium]|nr:hypothetical protein [Bacteroidia bacterium]